MPEPDPLPSIKIPWDSATPTSSGAGGGDAPPVPIPDHALIRRIGRGSYGEVWLARNVLGVYRAVKIIHRSSFDHDRPFEREFAGMQRFEPVSRSHESQLNILQVGRGPGCFYYVMELADDMGRGTAIDEGSYSPRNLRSDLLLHGRLPVDECIRLGLALTTALEHLHRHGLVHRDIKPSNIVFVNGIPKLADIGLVAIAEATMSFVGTEGYLPPEGPGTVQADVFSLGKVLYEISTGRDRQQFPELPTGVTELPDRAALAELNEVLLRACAPDVEQRYESAADMHADLALLQSGKSVARLRAVERRLKLAARAAVAVTVIALLAGAAFFYQQVQTREARRLASENQSLAESKTQLAQDKAKLADENREQLVRLRVGNGVRLLDEGDPSASLLWFAEALPLVTNRPAEEAVHRIRIQQVLQQTPRLLAVVGCSNNVRASAWSADGKCFALTTYTVPTDHWEWQAQLHDAEDGHHLWTTELGLQDEVYSLKASREGQRFLIRSDLGAVVLDSETGKALLPRLGGKHEKFAFSPDGRYLALAQSNHLIRVVSAVDGQLIIDLEGHTNQVALLAFSGNGNLLASGTKDRMVRLWRLPSGELLGPPLVHENPVGRIELSADGSLLLTKTDTSTTEKDRLVQVWQTRTGTRLGKPIREKSLVSFIAFSPGAGDRFIMGTDRHEIDVWDSATLERVCPPLQLSGSLARCWNFSPDGKALAVGCDDGSAYIWNLETGATLYPPFRHTGWVQSVHFSPDGNRLLTSGDDGTAKVWLLAQEQQSAAMTLPASIVGNKFWDTIPRGRTPGPIAIDLKDGALHLVDPERLVEVARLKPQEQGNGLHIWTAGSMDRFWAVEEGKGKSLDDGPSLIDLWEKIGDGYQCRQLPHPKGVAFMTFISNDSRLRTFCYDWSVRTWRTSDGTLESTHSVPKNYYYGNVTQSQGGSYWFRPDGSAVLLYLDPKADRQPGDPPSYHEQLFDPRKGEWIGAPYNPYQWGNINKMGFSPDGSRLAIVTRGQSGHIFDLRVDGKEIVHFKHGSDLLDLDWSPDGKRLLTAGLAHDARIWDAATGEQLLSPLLTGHASGRAARWSADGRFIVTRSDDHFAQVWDASTAEAVTPLLRHSGDIRWACITPGNRLITASEPNLLRAWDLKLTLLAPEILADYAKFLSGRRLNASGALLPLKFGEIGQLGRSLRARAPQLFTTP